MGLIRGGLFFFIVSLLFTSLFFSGFALTISTSLDKEKLKNEVVSTVAEQLAEQSLNSNNTEFMDGIEKSLPALEEECKTKNNVEIILDSNNTLIITCDSVNNGTDAVANEVLNELTEDFTDTALNEISSEDYGKNPLLKLLYNLFLSENSNDFWTNLFYYSLFFFLLLLIASFFLVENKSSFPITIGVLLIISSLPLFLVSIISSKGLGNSILSPIAVLFSNAYTIFFIYAVLGGSLIFFGISFKFLEKTYQISERFNLLKNMKKENKTKKPIKSKKGELEI